MLSSIKHSVTRLLILMILISKVVLTLIRNGFLGMSDILIGSALVRFLVFFQAEDGIRDYKVTGVQTCALPILVLLTACGGGGSHDPMSPGTPAATAPAITTQPGNVATTVGNTATFVVIASGTSPRSEEGGVGKEGGSRWAPYHLKKKEEV